MSALRFTSLSDGIIGGTGCISNPTTYHNDIRGIEMTKSILTQNHLKEIIHYNPVTGSFTWLVKIGSSGKGKEVGHLHDNGYRRCCIYKVNYYMHRLAFLYMDGGMPEFVDHINCIRNDNRWCNIRPSSRHHNNARMIPAKRELPRGVHKHRTGGNYYSKMIHNGINLLLGTFDTPEEASDVYELAKRMSIDAHAREVKHFSTY